MSHFINRSWLSAMHFSSNRRSSQTHVILLSQDLFKIPANQIGKMKVLMTMVGGKIVYQDTSWNGAQSAGSK
jgi:hypothetical protein